jgi:2,5-diamino-6-(ribosylamino)-4(3H)-pyrimidinone 5'-phosphate reductase
MNRPFTYINSAISADGKISSRERRQVRISGKEDLARVDSLRARSDAVMVGVGTVLADDPGLRVKSPSLRSSRLGAGLSENPLRVVADSLARTPPDAEVLGEGCIIATTRAAPEERLSALDGKCKLIVCGDRCVDLTVLTSSLYEMGVQKLMVEGGASLNWSMIEAELVDEIYVYVGAMVIGGLSAPTLVDGDGFRRDFPRLDLLSMEKLDDGALLCWRVGRREGPSD